MKLLVTGAAGHLGEAIVRLAPSQGWTPIGIDQRAGDHVHRRGDIRDARFVEEIVAEADAIVHAATLHKPHVVTHSAQTFVDVNVKGTLNLLEAAAQAGRRPFIFTSTTSAFGSALVPGPKDPAAWINETVVGAPKNIYGATKTAAETLCSLYTRTRGLDTVVLRTSRFFAEPDDNPEARAAFADENLKANEFLFRRVDIEDAAAAHFRALERAAAARGRMFVISAPTPFRPADGMDLRHDPAATLSRRIDHWQEIYSARGYRAPPDISRVYDSAAALRELGWEPVYDFAKILSQLGAGEPIGSPLGRVIGAKWYHDEAERTGFSDGFYPV